MSSGSRYGGNGAAAVKVANLRRRTPSASPARRARLTWERAEALDVTVTRTGGRPRRTWAAAAGLRGTPPSSRGIRSPGGHSMAESRQRSFMVRTTSPSAAMAEEATTHAKLIPITSLDESSIVGAALAIVVRDLGARMLCLGPGLQYARTTMPWVSNPPIRPTCHLAIPKAFRRLVFFTILFLFFTFLLFPPAWHFFIRHISAVFLHFLIFSLSRLFYFYERPVFVRKQNQQQTTTTRYTAHWPATDFWVYWRDGVFRGIFGREARNRLDLLVLVHLIFKVLGWFGIGGFCIWAWHERS